MSAKVHVSKSNDRSKQDFDKNYVMETPIGFCKELCEATEYVTDTANCETFERLILPNFNGRTDFHILDMGCCYGNTTMAVAHGMTSQEITHNWRDEESCWTIDKPRRYEGCKVTGVDISGPALAYGKKAGLYQDTIEADLNDPVPRAAVKDVLAVADVWFCVSVLCYLKIETVEDIVQAFANGEEQGYFLCNFLNPFGRDTANDMKKILLKHLNFVGSEAHRHRRMTPHEKNIFPGEEWVLNECWVLSRK